MAEAALLIGIATSVLKQLSSPALDEFRLLWSHKKHFEKLEDTVTTIKNVLQDADSKQATDAAVRGWLARLRAVLYEADDFFDSISAKVLLEKAKEGTEIGKKVRYFVSKPSRFASLIKNAHKVKKIREHFDDIARDINGFKFLTSQPDQDPKISKIGREQTHSYVRRDAVVGREQEAENLVRVLLDDSSQQQSRGFSVVAVIGIGGLGKTTLAQLVYNDDRVQKGFDLVMWACIDKISDQKQVLITLLKSATMREHENLVSELEKVDLDALQYKFRKEIEGKRFLLVLDDVWDVDVLSWGKLKEQLSSGNDGSKVLTTTRSTAIAQRLWAIKPYFHLQVLSDESAWLLFKKIAFANEEDGNDSELEKLGWLIKRKCANVPLAIVIIASLLREQEKERWPLVNDELSNLFPNGYENIMQVLEFSYKELPYPVKRCFGYCSLFQKDYQFEKDRLIHLWIAQGFVEPLQNQSLEDRGEEYFFCLVDRCFFHKIDATYQMHDLIHDLAIKVAGSENILVDHTPQGSWDKTVRHVSITYDFVSIVDHVCSFPHSKSIRTFLYDDQFRWKKNPFRSKFINVEKLVPCFKSLRVLVLRDIREVPTSIGELIHLRYLDLSDSGMGRLPSSICSLCHLQYLILRCCRHLSELPDNLGELTQLRYLDLSYNNELKRLPSSIFCLLHLESLILQSCTRLEELPEELGELTQLRNLDLFRNYELKRLPSSICRLLHLESLILKSCKRLKELPEELGELTQLRYLDLSCNDELKRLPSSICRLLHLESLILQSCTRLEELPKEMGVMQRLRHLALEYCDRLVISMSTLMSLMILKKLVVDIPSGALGYLDDLPTLWPSIGSSTASSFQFVLPSIELENSKTDAERSFRESRLRELAILCDIRLDSSDIRPKYQLISCRLKNICANADIGLFHSGGLKNLESCHLILKKENSMDRLITKIFILSIKQLLVHSLLRYNHMLHGYSEHRVRFDQFTKWNIPLLSV